MSSKIFFKLLLQVLCITSLVSAIPARADGDHQDPYLWLEDIDGKNALSWVRKTNAATDKSLGSDPLFRELYEEALNTLNRRDKLPEVYLRGDWIYNLHKDADHPRGLYRRSKLANFKSARPDWQTVLDIDAMSATDGINWVFQGMDCLKPLQEKCLVSLSPGGGDAHLLREFDAKTLKFVDNGFLLPTAKTGVTWLDSDHLFVATDFGPGSLTESGYPRIIKIWRRGTPLAQAKSVFETDKSAVRAYARRLHDEDINIDLLVENVSYWSNRYYQHVDGKNVFLNLPESAVVVDVFAGELVVRLQKDWQFGGIGYQQGAVVLVAPKTLIQHKGPVTLLIESKPGAVIEDLKVSKAGILVTVLEDVQSRIYRYQKAGDGWRSTRVKLPENGNIRVATSSNTTREFFIRYQDFLTPPSLYSIDNSLNVTLVLQQSPTFDAALFKVEQFFTQSQDGTTVPYFVVMHRNTRLNGRNPTHIFSYGGFRVALTPAYSGSYEDLNGVYGKAWLERGGVFVLANIRGGGEYGPAWHAAALLENRYKSFEDFEAIAEDLFKRKITSAQHLGIEGRSNGGLLVAATMIRNPKLYGAIICGVPLADMKRYHKLLAGASWMAEFGNPDTDDWAFMKDYSPYQNVSAEQSYPPIFFFTSTRDDRVHPGHARKMAAKMIAQGHAVEYYENTEGGHKGSVTSEQLARRLALAYTHLWRNLE